MSSSAGEQFARFADQRFHIVSLGNDGGHSCGGGFPLQDVVAVKRAENDGQMRLSLVQMAGRSEAIHYWHG